MQSSLYVALSAQVALQSRLDTIAQNVANSGSAGYRADEVKFDSVLSDTGSNGSLVAFVAVGGHPIRRTAGELVKTGNPLDVAVKGPGWLSISTPQGLAYTRNGQLQMTASGDLTTSAGAQVLDAGGAPVQLDPAGGTPVITADGAIYQGQKRAGTIGLFTLPAQARLSHVEGGVISNIPGTPVTDFAANGFVQGYSEGSNVNPISEMTHLIQVQREFDGLNTVMQAAETSFKNAIQTLGSSS